MQISHITYEVAKAHLSLKEIAAQHQITQSEAVVYEKIMGLNIVPRYSGMTIRGQLISVVKNFLLETVLDVNSVKYILFAHTSEYVAPFSSYLLQEIANDFLFKNAIAFGVTVNKCASAFQLCSLASQLFGSLHESEKIIVLIADIAFTKLLSSISGTTVLGDAASALLLEKQSSKNTFIDFLINVEDKFAAGTYAAQDELTEFKFLYPNAIATLILEIVEKNHLILDQIQYIFPNNVNTLSWRLISEKLHFPVEKIYLKNVATMAHCFGSDPFINLKDAIHDEKLKPGDFYLLVTAGLGATFAAILMRY